ncbi:MAG: DUF1616 domain-containing protein [Candidatus Helarchaeota archaeon]
MKNKSDTKLSDIIINILKNNKNLTIKQLISKINSEYNYSNNLIIKCIKDMADQGLINISKITIPKEQPFKNPIINYFLSKNSLSFWLSLIIIVISFFLVYYVPQNSIWSDNFWIFSLGILRIIFGTIITLFLPGYLFLSLLYYNKKDLDILEKFGLSIGLSISIVLLIGLIFNFTPIGITLNPIISTINIISLVLLVISTILKSINNDNIKSK